MEESFGIVNIYCCHPYYESLTSYVKSKSHLLGLYYPSGLGTGFLLYDTFTGVSMRGVSIGEILMYKYITEVRTSKYQAVDDDLREVFMSFCMRDVKDRRRRIQKCLLTGKKKKIVLNSYSHLLGRETIYKRETEGSENTLLDTFLFSLHKDLYKVLYSLSLNGIVLNTLSIRKREEKEKENVLPLFVQSLKENVNYLTLTKDKINLGEDEFQRVIVVRYVKSEESLKVHYSTMVIEIDDSSSDFTFLHTNILKDILKYISSTSVNSFKSLEKCVLEELSRR